MFFNPTTLPLSIVTIIDYVQNILAGSSKVQVDPSRPVAGCRMVMDPKGKQPVVAQCFTDKERFPAAQMQGLECRMKPKLTIEPGKATVDFLVFCGPKTLAQREARRAKVYFGEQIQMRTFKKLPSEQIREFFKKLDPQTIERLKTLQLHHKRMPPRALPNYEYNLKMQMTR